MAGYEKFFTTYESLSPPPIQSEGYQNVLRFYQSMTQPELVEEHVVTEEEPKEENPYIPYKLNQWVASNYRTPEWRTSNWQSSNEFSDVIATAKRQVGLKYKWGGDSPSTGFDCSGLISYAFRLNGILLPRTVKLIEKYGTEVQLSDVKPGDIICLSSSGPSGKHAKLVTLVDNGRIWTVEAKGQKEGVVEDLLIDTSKITTIRRIMSNLPGNSIIDYFMGKGLSLELARGIYGNIMQESRGNHRAVSSDGNKSYGLAQWTGARKAKLFLMYGKNPTPTLLLDFLWWELNNTHKDVLNSLLSANTVEDATRIVMNGFEKPNPKYANFALRLKYAKS